MEGTSRVLPLETEKVGPRAVYRIIQNQSEWVTHGSGVRHGWPRRGARADGRRRELRVAGRRGAAPTSEFVSSVLASPVCVV